MPLAKEIFSLELLRVKFWVNEEVYLTENGVLEGLSLIQSFGENVCNYTLTEKDGITQWRGGRKVKEENARHGKR